MGYKWQTQSAQNIQGDMVPGGKWKTSGKQVGNKWEIKSCGLGTKWETSGRNT